MYSPEQKRGLRPSMSREDEREMKAGEEKGNFINYEKKFQNLLAEFEDKDPQKARFFIEEDMPQIEQDTPDGENLSKKYYEALMEEMKSQNLD